MLASTSFVLASLFGVAYSHFQLQFPAPRGKFVEDDEPTFCDGYDNPATNRTAFPITGGFFKLNSEHQTWTIGVNLTTNQNPQNFADFSTTLFPFVQKTGEGVSCFPLDLSSAGVQDGQNVTLQVVFDGSDGHLYQCADLTISAAAKPSDSACNFASSSGSNTPSGSATAPPSQSSPSSSNPPNGALALGSRGALLALAVSVVGVAAGALVV
ncbi:hypothetical protein R3P38DRAFT_2824396 [Favolaschia claudopus]|uniref:Copper acquisition factor BIM1-like domain-containing protein n=1 Tax=Favolaschia claudopus TaxID=2862362 RepID=A0AAW0EGJ8_9AGAR